MLYLSSSMMDYYSILGVNKDATADDIKRAYRKQASVHHPDKGGDTKRFQEIQEAYATLSDPEKRAHYDNPQPTDHFRFGAGDMDEIFRNFGFHFGAGGNPFAQQYRRPQRNRDLKASVVINLADTAERQEKIMSIRHTSGERETVTITIPQGIMPGSMLKFPGLGDKRIEQVPRGDLYVAVQVILPDNVEIAHNDLYQKYSLNVLDAITGLTATITTPFGDECTFEVPAGIQQGTRIRLKHQGLYNKPDRGDLYLVVDLTVPRDLKPEQIELINQAKTVV